MTDEEINAKIELAYSDGFKVGQEKQINGPYHFFLYQDNTSIRSQSVAELIKFAKYHGLRSIKLPFGYEFEFWEKDGTT